MTSPSPLERLAGPGNVLAKEAPNAQEFEGLVRSGLARLKDAEREANSLYSRFDLAYSGAHALCLAALRHHGFRPSKRYIVFQVLPDTLRSRSRGLARLVEMPRHAKSRRTKEHSTLTNGCSWICSLRVVRLLTK